MIDVDKNYTYQKASKFPINPCILHPSMTITKALMVTSTKLKTLLLTELELIIKWLQGNKFCINTYQFQDYKLYSHQLVVHKKLVFLYLCFLLKCLSHIFLIIKYNWSLNQTQLVNFAFSGLKTLLKDIYIVHVYTT